jgi:hypothetical protein
MAPPHVLFLDTSFVLAQHPEKINIAFLKQFPSFDLYRKKQGDGEARTKGLSPEVMHPHSAFRQSPLVPYGTPIAGLSREVEELARSRQTFAFHFRSDWLGVVAVIVRPFTGVPAKRS